MRVLAMTCAAALCGTGPLGGVATARTAAPPHGIEVRRGAALLRVEALSDGVLRVRLAPDGRLPEDASWAVPAAARARRAKAAPSADGFRTAALRVRVDPATLRLVVEDARGRVVVADADEPVRFDGRRFTLRKAMAAGERYHGMGDKTGPFDRRGAAYVNWNTDVWGYDRATDPTYKSIPFFVASGGAGGAYGLFLDNPRRGSFDFGHRDEGVLAVGADDGPIDYYLIAGPSPAEVVRRYADLTGKSPLPPRWALGFQQSRYSYMTDAEVRGVADRLRRERVPADAIWLDIDFQDRNRPFTVDRRAFPDLRKLAGDLRLQGVKLVAVTDLHVAHAPGQGYAPYDGGTAGGHFVRRADGGTYVAPVWPGPSVFPDFTAARSRDWWGGLYRGFLEDGIAGFWNDMNEPAVFGTPTKTMPPGNRHRIASDDFAPREATHAEVHNIYGMQNARATFEGLKRLRPDLRPYVMTRAAYAGAQRYAVTWTGDNSSTWEHLKLSVQQLLNLGMSGFAHAGADVGGFIGGAGPELMTRWYQIAAWTPVFRAHAAKGAPRGEPWADGPEHLGLRRRAIEERYRLLPYIYGLAERHARTGDPIMRPVFYDHPVLADASCDQSMAFTLGRDLLVAPSGKPESPHAYDVCLPSGGWYDYWTGLPAGGEPVTGGAGYVTLTETPRLDRLPVFVRAGAVLPRQPLTRSTAETPQGPLSLHIYPGEDCRGELYHDDGLTTAHERGAFLRQTIRCERTRDGLTIEFGPRAGGFAPWWREIAVTVHGWDGGARIGRGVAARSDGPTRTVSFVIPDQPRPARFTVGRR